MHESYTEMSSQTSIYPTQSILTFTSNVLPIGTEHQVICCNVQNGPNQFFVQLMSSLKELQKMNTELKNAKNLINLHGPPSVGMACIARFSEDRQLYRAVIMDVKQLECQVSYVDYGNTEYVPYSDLYEIQTQFLNPKIFALRFSLMEDEELDFEDPLIKETFDDLARGKDFLLKVMPLKGSSFVQCCKLYGIHSKIDLLEPIKRLSLRYTYRKSETLKSEEMVVIRYIESPMKFFVQKVEKMDQFEDMMDKLYEYCKKEIPLKMLHKNIACAVKHENAWYRAKILNLEGSVATIQLVDFGNVCKINVAQLFHIDEALIKFPPQAICCCLKGFENIKRFIDSVTDKLEMLAEGNNSQERRRFKCFIIELVNENICIDLIDDTKQPVLNLTNQLLKLSLPFDKYVGLEKKEGKQSLVLGERTRNTLRMSLVRDYNSNSSFAYSDSNLKDNNSNWETNIKQLSYLSRNLWSYSPPPIQNSNFYNKSVVSVNQSLSSLDQRFKTNSHKSSNNIYYASVSSVFPERNIIIPSTEKVRICWWISPNQFYVHNKSMANEYRKLKNNLQKFYTGNYSAHMDLTPGVACVFFKENDGFFYRGKILVKHPQEDKFKIHAIDIGSIEIIHRSHIRMVGEKFINIPQLAILCSLDSIILNAECKQIANETTKLLKCHSLTCHYIEKKNNIYYVELIAENGSVKELFIRDGLVTEVSKDFDIDLISGRQLVAKLCSIRDLRNFKIQITDSQLKLLCATYNVNSCLKFSPSLSEIFRKNYEGKFGIVEIEAITEDKILMVKPLIRLLNTMSPKIICDYPIVYRKLRVTLAYIKTTNILFVHTISSRKWLEDSLLKEMVETYENKGELMEKRTVGNFCAVKSVDRNWYRARIVSSDNERVKVFCIDNGYTENIYNFENLKRLEEEDYTYSSLAIPIFLPLECTTNKDSKVLEKMNSLIKSNEFEIKIIDNHKLFWICDIIYNNHNVIDDLEKLSLVKRITDLELVKSMIDNNEENMISTNIREDNTAVKNLKTDENLTESCEKGNMLITAVLSHYDNPGRFFLQLKENYEELLKFQEDIQIVAESLPPMTNIVTGASCIAQSQDKLWYRAKVVDSEIMVLEFIDYGNADVIDPEAIKEMNDAFNVKKPFAIPCALPIAPSHTADWADEANDIFKTSLNKIVHFEYISKGEKKSYVNLMINGENVGEKIIGEGCARQLEVIKSGELCYVSNINNLQDFSVQLEGYSDALELVAAYFSQARNFPIVENPEKGKICAAFFSEDGQWYRAMYLNDNSEGYEVLFIDYGNISITTEIRAISEEIANLPPLSIKCSLWMPNHVLGWSEEAEKKFVEISGIGKAVFTVELIEPGDHATIQLYIENKNILEELEKVCDRQQETKNTQEITGGNGVSGEDEIKNKHYTGDELNPRLPFEYEENVESPKVVTVSHVNIETESEIVTEFETETTSELKTEVETRPVTKNDSINITRLEDELMKLCESETTFEDEDEI